MIKIEKLSFSYTGNPPFLLDEIDLSIHHGDYVSVVGENGCGKSTLLRLILHFLKPTHGSVTSEAKMVGYVPQRSDSLNFGFPITVFEMLDSYRKLLKIDDKKIISETLSIFGLNNFLDTLVHTLSGGQIQKTLIARALIGHPELLLLDEPSTGIDIDSQKEIYATLKKLNTVNGITIVSVEHNLDAAIANSTLIYHMSGGKGHFCSPNRYAAEYLKNQKEATNIV